MGSTSPYDLRWVEVVSVSNPTPRMRRVVFGGPALDGFTLKPDVLAPHIGLIVPSQDGSPAPPLRVYSVRRFDPAAGTLELNFVLHGRAGVASSWAARARPGERAGITVSGGIPMRPAARYVVAGDLTAVPAIARLLDGLPAGASAEVFIEVPDAGEEQELPSRASTSITWFHRRPGTPPDASRLPDAVIAATSSNSPARTDGVAVWAGTEHRAAQRIRSHVRQTLRLPAESCSVVAYWKAAVAQGGFQHYD
ncbi:siderophore-interacting protein [Azospirillum doebereinerae]|uniref:siderophore-interacting protein n=1 Tax=Azospirillum doebereinerae TaxID=92933 RepID=UPI001EE50887|nr:siderophore-interacting protein [Azospirillum doebereinerae]MCG5238648.1 siderophore-interacting protein [Azospirillum doebereinerae]